MGMQLDGKTGKDTHRRFALASKACKDVGDNASRLTTYQGGKTVWR
ncbi:MAG: hypothetical protein Q7R34_01475 [Dehalococcoidia bacterium]|nr:hypothetical protein [Dehalococcoidia bacterium]